MQNTNKLYNNTLMYENTILNGVQEASSSNLDTRTKEQKQLILFLLFLLYKRLKPSYADFNSAVTALRFWFLKRGLISVELFSSCRRK